MNIDKNNKEFKLVIILLIALGVSVSAFTYAYFVANIQSEAQNLAESGRILIDYSKGDDVVGSIAPAASSNDGLATEIRMTKLPNSVKALTTVILSISELDEEIATSSLKWELYIDGEIYDNGTFEGKNTTDNNYIELVRDYDLPYEETSFAVRIWLDGNTTGNEVENKSFEGSISAIAKSR